MTPEVLKAEDGMFHGHALKSVSAVVISTVKMPELHDCCCTRTDTIDNNPKTV